MRATSNTNVGRVDVYYGATNPGSAVTLPLPTGTAGTPRMGYTMTAGDVNGDGFSDLLVAAPTANTQGSTFKDGEVYIYLGQSGVRLTASSQPNVILKGRIASPDTTSTALGMGYFLTVADFNGDGINDIAASSPYENANKGYVRIFAGQSAGSWSPTGAQVVVQASSALATLATTRTGVTSGPQLGWRIASPGDLDGDGKAELVASAPTGTLALAGPALRPIYVASGAMLSGAVTVENTAGVFYSVDAATSAPTTSQFGYDLFAGDVTGDGVKDVVATDVDGRVVVMSGALLASFVPTAGGSVAPGLDASASARVGSVNSFASQSGGVPQLHWLGDVTGDGIDDFASFRSSPTTSTEIRIYYGRSASDWTSISVAAGGAQLTPAADALIARGTISDYAGLVGGHFLGGTLRDLVVLDIAGSAIVLSGP